MKINHLTKPKRIIIIIIKTTKFFKFKRTHIKNTSDPLSLEQLGAGGVVVAAEVEKLRQDLGGESADLERGGLLRR